MAWMSLYARGEERAMPTIAQCCARRWPLRRTVDWTGVVARLAALMPALAGGSDFAMRRVAIRGVFTDTLPVRTAVGPDPTRAFDPSIGFDPPLVGAGEQSTSHAWLNHPPPRGMCATPPEVGMQALAALNWEHCARGIGRRMHVQRGQRSRCALAAYRCGAGAT